MLLHRPHERAPHASPSRLAPAAAPGAPEKEDHHRAAPRPADISFLLCMLMLYGAVVVALQVNIPWRVLANARRAGARPPPMTSLKKDPHQKEGSSELAAREPLASPPRHAPRAGRDRSACVARVAIYYAPPSTQPRLEDFEFLIHAVRVWQATEHAAGLVILTDPDAASQKPLKQACRALPQCRELPAPSNLEGSSSKEGSIALVVQAALRSLPAHPARQGHRPPKASQACAPRAGVVVYAPAQGKRGASLDSRALFEQANAAANASACIDIHAAPHPCMAYAFAEQAGDAIERRAP